MKYTVLLLYPDYMTEDYGQETYLAWVDASDPNDAVKKAQARVAYENDATDSRDDFFVLLVAEGHITDVRGEPLEVNFESGELLEGTCGACGAPWEAHDENGECPEDFEWIGEVEE